MDKVSAKNIMTKAFCDKCGKEITTQEVGKLIYVEWTSTLAIKEAKAPSQLVRKEKDLCSNCMVDILKMFKK